MTRIERSPEQLDAEARGRVIAPALRQTRSVLTEWRVAIASEPPMRTTTPRPPELVETVDGVREKRIDPGTRTGVTMAGPFLRYIDTAFPTEPGGKRYPSDPDRPAHAALVAWDRLCRKYHRRWSDHHKPECVRSSVNPCNCGGRPVCAEIAWAVLRDRTTLLWAADHTEVSFPRAENLLRLAIDWMARQQRRWIRDTNDVPVRHEREGSEHCEVCRGQVAG